MRWHQCLLGVGVTLRRVSPLSAMAGSMKVSRLLSEEEKKNGGDRISH